MATPGWYPDPDVHGGQRYFDGSRWTDDRIAAKKPAVLRAIPTAGWIAIAVVAVIAVVGVVAVTATSASRDEESYQYGYDEVSQVAVTMLQMGIDGTEYVCEQAFGTVILGADGLVEEDVVAGCVDALNE